MTKDLIRDFPVRLERRTTPKTVRQKYSAGPKARADLAEEYQKLIKTDEDKKSFNDIYKAVRTIYKYAEDHLFWVEHWFHTIWFDKVREFGRLLVKCGMLKAPDDIYLFNRFEVPLLMEDMATTWALGEGVPSRFQYWQTKAEKRKKIIEAAKMYRVSLQTVYRWIREDGIKVKYELGYRFIDVDGLENAYNKRHNVIK
jgi:pyruvate,water dikinase